MPFGLTNAPTTLEKMINNLFIPNITYLGVFFDDVIVYSKSIEEHKKHL